MENDALKVENFRLLGVKYHRRELFAQKENAPAMKPRIISTKPIRNPYLQKSAGALQARK
jgi:hypothetical protein